MKKLIVLAVLLALAMPAWAVTTVYPADGTGGTSIYPAPSVGAGSALANIGDWALATGVGVTNGLVQLTRNEDRFNDDSFDTTFLNSIEYGGGVVNESSMMQTNSDATVTKAAIWYYKTAITNTTQKYTIRVKDNTLTTSSDVGPLIGIQQNASNPTVDTTTNLAGKRVLEVIRGSTNLFQVLYWDSGGTIHYWNGSIWTTTPTNLAAVNLFEPYEIEYITTDTTWKVIVTSTVDGTVIADTDTVLWSGTRDTGTDDYWLYGGDVFVGTYQSVFNYFWFSNQYLTTSPTATMGQITVGVPINQIPIIETNESGCSISWDYDIGAGWVTGKTLAQLKTTLVGTSPATLNLQANLASNGNCKAAFYTTGGSLTE